MAKDFSYSCFGENKEVFFCVVLEVKIAVLCGLTLVAGMLTRGFGPLSWARGALGFTSLKIEKAAARLLPTTAVVLHKFIVG